MVELSQLKSKTVEKHLRILLVLSVVTRLLTLLLVYLSTYLPLFDSSSKLSPTSRESTRWTSALLRWDAFHFVHIADKGYVYEHEWAFFPGTPLVMRTGAQVLRLAGLRGASEWTDLLQGGALVALACDSTHTLYHLTLHHLRSPSIALIASILSLLPSSPATLRFASYSEPFFTYLSYKGMLCCTRSQWLYASFYFAFAGMFRSNGILLSGYIVWGLVIQPSLDHRRVSFKDIPYAVLLAALISLPFVGHNYVAYQAFCTHQAVRASWCSNFPPSIYAHVQDKYWNGGLLRYWTVQQLPNFLISAPPLLLLFAFSLHHLSYLRFDLFKPIPAPKSKVKPASPFFSPTLVPYTIHALFLCLTLFFAAHTQIALRLLPSLPTMYWAAAWLVMERPKWGRWWVAWSTVWGAVSIVLWVTFLPPA